MSGDLLTTADVAGMLRCSARTVHRLVASKALPARRVTTGPSGVFLFERADVEPLVARSRARRCRRAA